MHPVRLGLSRHVPTAGAGESWAHILASRRAGVIDACTLYSIAIGACHRSRARLVRFPGAPGEITLHHTRVRKLHALRISSLQAARRCSKYGVVPLQHNQCEKQKRVAKSELHMFVNACRHLLRPRLVASACGKTAPVHMSVVQGRGYTSAGVSPELHSDAEGELRTLGGVPARS